MLILTRKTGQSIVIADDVVVTVVDVSGDQVRLGVEAPREIAVHREEVYRQISQENEAARALDATSLLSSSSPKPSSLPTRPTRPPRRPSR